MISFRFTCTVTTRLKLKINHSDYSSAIGCTCDCRENLNCSWWLQSSLLDRCSTSSWWRHQTENFSALLAFCAANSPVICPRKGQWRGALIVSLSYASINGWVNDRMACDLRRNRAHYDVTVMGEFWSPVACISIGIATIITIGINVSTFNKASERKYMLLLLVW